MRLPLLKLLRLHGVHLHRHPHPELCLRIQQLAHANANRLVKIKAHTTPSDLPDLLCYHALGNMVADQAASEVCNSCHPLLTDAWRAQVMTRKHEMEQLEQFYRLSLAVQSYRKLHEQHVPASFNPMEPHPMRQARRPISLPCALTGRLMLLGCWMSLPFELINSSITLTGGLR